MNALAAPVKPLRVIIVGGGLGGLALGQLLRDVPYIDLTLYERSRSSIDRLSGFRVMLSSFVLKNLKGKLRREVWRKIMTSIGTQPPEGQEICFMKSNGEALYTWAPDEVMEQYSVSRWSLREGLCHDCESFARFGKKFERFERLLGGRIKVIFADGTTDECDLLVGADGLHSRVRKSLLPEAKMTSTDQYVIYFKIPLTPETQALMKTGSGIMVRNPTAQSAFIS